MTRGAELKYISTHHQWTLVYLGAVLTDTHKARLLYLFWDGLAKWERSQGSGPYFENGSHRITTIVPEVHSSHQEGSTLYQDSMTTQTPRHWTREVHCIYLKQLFLSLFPYSIFYFWLLFSFLSHTCAHAHARTHTHTHTLPPPPTATPCPG